MHKTDLNEIRYYLKSNLGPIDDQVFENYEDAEQALKDLQNLSENYKTVTIESLELRKNLLIE